jgi:hypothetical protein
VWRGIGTAETSLLHDSLCSSTYFNAFHTGYAAARMRPVERHQSAARLKLDDFAIGQREASCMSCGMENVG